MQKNPEKAKTYIANDFAENGQRQTSLWYVDTSRQLKQFFDCVTSSLSRTNTSHLYFNVAISRFMISLFRFILLTSTCNLRLLR